MPAEFEKHPKSRDEPSGDAPKAKRTTSGPELSADLVSFTIDVKSGRIAKVEAVDPSGDRHALSEEEALRLATRHVATLEDVLERAFEAGISAVLGDTSATSPSKTPRRKAKRRRGSGG